MFDLKSVAPYLAATGNALLSLDENTSGADDFAGELLVYTGDVIVSVAQGLDLPPIPDAIAKGTSERITGASRAILIVASSVLAIARFQVAGKAATVLRYVDQALRNLLAGKPVPAAPALS